MMTKHTKRLSAFLAAMIILYAFLPAAAAQISSFELISTQQSETLGGTVYRYRHTKTGAEVIYNDNHAKKREFALGFKTPPTDSKGANHVLEHALFCGSEKYPTKNIMHYIQNGTSSLILNGVTADDCTYYLINTANETEYYNMIDVYLNGIFHPLFLTDENIFRQQGIRMEYADGRAQYNGVVYNELRIKNLNTQENSVNFLADKLYRALYGNTTPAFSAGGELDAIKELTYADLLRVYNTFYIPSNSMTYLSGEQDINKTLAALDGFFSQNHAAAPSIAFPDTKQLPADAVQEYNITMNTQTVDIGFMSAGVPADAEAKERYARDILFDIIGKKMEEETGCGNMYTSGGNTGGVANLAMILSEIPIEKKDGVLAAYNNVLAGLAENGIDEQDINQYIEKRQKYFYANWENIFTGLMYQNDPLAYTEANAIYSDLKGNKAYFLEILKKYFTQTPYRVTIVSGNGSFGSEDSRVTVSAEELEKIKQETEAFQRWNDAEDNPAVIEKIPFLTLDAVKDAPEKSEPRYEEQSGISFYHTQKDDGEAGLYFPLDIRDEDFDTVQLMYYFLQDQAEQAGLAFYTMLAPFEQVNNPQKINPHFCIGFSGEHAAETVKKAVDFLQAEDTWNADDLAEYVQKTPKKILDSYYDPYYVSAALKDSALSAGGRFDYWVPQNTLVKGSPHYYQFLKGLKPNDALVQQLKALAQDVILNSKPVVEYVGNAEGYGELKNAVLELFANGKQHKSAELCLPAGCRSAATITKLADANHFMLAASYDGQKYSGKMAVLGKVLSTKYITPTMRGKHGAYGCGLYFREDGMTAAVTGLADIDLAIELWRGMGGYLRTLNMTQHELDSFIVSAVQEYDEWDYTASEHGADFALRGKSGSNCEKIRQEMLSTTVADLKGYADWVDGLVSQQRVFAVLGKSAADSASFDFAYYANADTLNVVPQLQKNPGAYINGRSESTFTPNDVLTKAEAAALIARILCDQSTAHGPSPFYDVTPTDWFYQPIVSLAEKGMITGCGDGSFLPNQQISRGEFAAILARLVYNEAAGQAIAYEDVAETDWFYPAIVKMTANGFITGYEDNAFRPNTPITRAEAVAIINRMIGKTDSGNLQNPFTDIQNHWALKEITAAVNQ